jgi:hypothetical protein
LGGLHAGHPAQPLHNPMYHEHPQPAILVRDGLSTSPSKGAHLLRCLQTSHAIAHPEADTAVRFVRCAQHGRCPNAFGQLSGRVTSASCSAITSDNRSRAASTVLAMSRGFMSTCCAWRNPANSSRSSMILFILPPLEEMVRKDSSSCSAGIVAWISCNISAKPMIDVRGAFRSRATASAKASSSSFRACSSPSCTASSSPAA